MSNKERNEGLRILAKMDVEAPKTKVKFEKFRLKRTESLKNLITYLKNPNKYNLIII